MVKQFIRFGLVGVVNTTLDFLIYAFLTRSFFWFQDNYLLANLLSFSLATINSYLLNKQWTFRDKNQNYRIPALPAGRQYSKFYLVSLGGLALTELILYILVEAGFYDLIAKAAAVAIVLFWNFFVNKYWTFKKSKNLL